MSKSWIGFLKGMAWINAIVGIIGAISYWCLFGRVERLRPGSSVLTETVINWPAIGIGCAILIGSLTILGFLMVMCFIAESINQDNTTTEVSETLSDDNETILQDAK